MRFLRQPGNGFGSCRLKSDLHPPGGRMRRTRSLLAALGTCAMVAGCQPAAETAEQAAQRLSAEAAAAKTAIEASNVRFAAHFNAGHGDSVAAFYTEDGRVMAPNMAVASGRQAIA